MIPSIIIICLSFYWLMRESDWLRIRLEQYSNYRTGVDPALLERVNANLDATNKTVRELAHRYEPPTSQPILQLPIGYPILQLDTIHYKPSQFETLDIPELKGELNIVCKRC